MRLIPFAVSPTWRQIADSCGGNSGPFRARKFGVWCLNGSWNCFCEGEVQRASTQKGGHRRTTSPVLTLRELQQSFPAKGEPTGRHFASGFARFQAKQLTFRPRESIGRGSRESRILLEMRPSLLRLSEGLSRGSNSHARPAPSLQPIASEATPCQANRQRMWNRDVSKRAFLVTTKFRCCGKNRNPKKSRNRHSSES